MLKVPDKEISQSIQRNKEGKILNNNLMNTKSTLLRFILELDGDTVLQQIRLHLRSGSRTMNGSRIKDCTVIFQCRNHQHGETCGFTTRNNSYGIPVILFR